MKKLIVLALVLGLVTSAFGTVSEDFELLTPQPWTDAAGLDNGAGAPAGFTNYSYGAGVIGSLANEAFAGNASMNAMHSVRESSNTGLVFWEPAGYADEMKPVIELSFDLSLDYSGVEGDTGGRAMVGWHIEGSGHYIDLWFEARVSGAATLWGRELFGSVDPDAGYLDTPVTGFIGGGAYNTVEIRIDENVGLHGQTSARINGGAWATIDRSLYDIESLAAIPGGTRLKHQLTGSALFDNYSQTGTPEPATIALLGMGALALIRKRR
ncbi:PEP-CTERM sorting domain-containing protein [Planctomycetota bacterium]